MKKIISVLSLAILMGCSSVKEIRGLLSDGNYDAALAKSIEELREDKISKGQQNYIVLLEEAFDKAKIRDQQQIDFLTKDANPAHYEQIYKLYLDLHHRQERIKPLLPLRIMQPNREAYFAFENYDNQLISYKQNLTEYLYLNAKKLMQSSDKMAFRKAFDDFAYLNSLTPNYKDVGRLMQESHYKGTDFIYFYTKNDTDMIIPSRLQEALLDFGTYGLNDQWTVYHSKKQSNTSYDYEMQLNFRQINISPEQVKEREFSKEKIVVDGKKALLNDKGIPVKDDKGNNVMVDNQKTIRANIYEFTQYKACRVAAKVDFIHHQSHQLIETFPLSSEFVFEHKYATFSGDREACDQSYFRYFGQRSTAFPSNEQMVYDAGEDLKKKLKTILQRNKR